MAGSYDILKATLDHDGTISEVSMPVQAFHHTVRIPGQRLVGAFQPGVSRVGSQFMSYNGVVFELRGQAASGTPTPEANIFAALGFAQSGATGFTHALGDPHENSDTPAGDLDRIDALTLNVDGLDWVADNVVADATFLWRAGQIPTMTCSFVGLVPDAIVAIPAINASGAVVLGPRPAPWHAAAMTIGGVANIRVVEVSVSLNNQLRMRADANAVFGFAPPTVPSRNVTGHIIIEAEVPTIYAPEDLARAGTDQALQWDYFAGGATFKSWRNTITVSLQDPEPTDLDNVLGYRLPFQASPLTGPLTMVNT